MKKQLIFNLTILTLVLVACGGQTTQTTPEPVAPTQAESKPIVIPTLTVAAPTETSMPTEVSVPATDPPATSGVSFANDVVPILAGSCNECHGGKQTKAGLNVTTHESLMAGSFNGVVIVAGNSAESLLVQFVTEGKMPKRGPKLTPEQVQTISEWIDAGALNN